MIWNKLPKEVKVSLFITMSYTISEIISNLEGINVVNGTYKVLLVAGINIILVFLKELRRRISAVRAIVESSKTVK